MAEDQVVTCGECGGKNRIQTSMLARGVRARCGYCDAPLPIYGEGSDVALLRPAVIERGPRDRPRQGRWFFGFLTGLIVTTVALYFLDRRIDLQAIEIGGTRIADVVDRSWDRLLAFFDRDSEVAEPDPEPSPPATDDSSAAGPDPEPDPAPAQDSFAAEPDPEPSTAPAENDSRGGIATRSDATSATSAEPLAAVETEEVMVSIPSPDDSTAPTTSPTAYPLPSPPTSIAEEPAAPELVREPISPGIVFNETGREGVAPLNIVTPDGQDYFVKLVDSATGEDAVGLYVRGGSTAKFNVPLGIYDIRYASGTTWYGLEDLFGPATTYAEANRTFDFRKEDDQYAGYTLTLIMQEGGNLDTRTIEGDAF
jgi:hypothetical protein